MLKKLFVIILGIMCVVMVKPVKKATASSSKFITIETSKGKVVIETLPKIAPNHVKRIKELVKQGFYDGIIFHRVIEGFMAQTGDPSLVMVWGWQQHVVGQATCTTRPASTALGPAPSNRASPPGGSPGCATAVARRRR